MNIEASLLEAQPAGVAVATDLSGLSAFREETCAVLVWQRSTPADKLAWLAGLDPEQLPKGRVTGAVEAVAETVNDLCESAAMPSGPERDWLEADIVKLAQRFADVVEPRQLRVRLDVITTNACRRFHVDAITSRLVCTYRGTGTQYGVAAGGQDPETIFTVDTGDPIFLRGTRWPATPSPGLLHRSPPIEGTGETRLVLVLDPVNGPEDEF